VIALSKKSREENPSGFSSTIKIKVTIDGTKTLNALNIKG
jgi:hypothetical protein